MIEEFFTREQAEAIICLAGKLEGRIAYGPKGHKFVAVVADGVPIMEGVRFAFKDKGISHLNEIFNYLVVSSKQEFIDLHQLDRLKKESGKRIYIDWRTKTGALGEILRKHDPECMYAVLSDPAGKADISVTKEDIPKINFPDNYDEIMDLIGIKVDIEKLKSGAECRYLFNFGPKSEAFYSQLYSLMDKVGTDRYGRVNRLVFDKK